jgi:membrane fusion protein (multidrug efflux system)
MEKNVSKKLEGKIALVTGGSRGIGAAIAKRLAADGAAVAITYAKDGKAASAVVEAIEREQAALNLGYVHIQAPVAGIVMKRSAQVGSRVQAGQQLLTISEIGGLWITANFKETQLLNMRPGQRAVIHVDSLDRDFQGSVETIGGSTGAVASTIPPENATGNYVKVVQRIPARIALDANQDQADRLRPGMSVEPKVRVRQ